MAVHVAGLISVIVFYLAILVVGLLAGRKKKKSSQEVDIFLANRSLGPVVMIFTLTATMVGGGYINGTAEMIYLRGFIWTQAPIAFNISLLICGLIFAPPVRRGNYITIFDPIQEKYGNRLGALLFIPQLMGDLFWSAAILAALGASLAIILELDGTIAIIISAAVAVGYTFFGGLYSVAYTDIIQMICIFVGLFLAFPFALTHEAVDLSKVSDGSWKGTLNTNEIGVYIDSYLLMIFGGTPWQVYYQRALACRTDKVAKWSSVAAGVFAAIQAIPPMAFGIAASVADWNMTDYNGTIPLPADQVSVVLPLALQYLCPTAVSVIGLGAVSAAVMSSADSCVLSTGSVITHNIYANMIRPQASNREKLWVLRISILVSGALGTIIAISVHSIYGLFFLCADMMYVINFPQLVIVLWIGFANTYGYVVGFFLAMFLRVAAGEPLLGLPALIRYPGYDPVLGQLFPFRTFTMVTGFVVTLGVSLLVNQIFRRGILPARFDFLRCVMNRDYTITTSKGDNSREDETKNAEEMVPLSGSPDMDSTSLPTLRQTSSGNSRPNRR